MHLPLIMSHFLFNESRPFWSPFFNMNSQYIMLEKILCICNGLPLFGIWLEHKEVLVSNNHSSPNNISILLSASLISDTKHVSWWCHHSRYPSMWIVHVYERIYPQGLKLNIHFPRNASRYQTAIKLRNWFGGMFHLISSYIHLSKTRVCHSAKMFQYNIKKNSASS